MGFREALLGMSLATVLVGSGCAASAAPSPPPRIEAAPVVVPPVDVVAIMTPESAPNGDSCSSCTGPRFASTIRIGENNPDPVVDGPARHGGGNGSGNRGGNGGQAVARASTPARTYYRAPAFLSGATSRALSQGSTNGYSNANGSFPAPQSFGPRAMQ